MPDTPAPAKPRTGKQRARTSETPARANAYTDARARAARAPTRERAGAESARDPARSAPKAKWAPKAKSAPEAKSAQDRETAAMQPSERNQTRPVDAVSGNLHIRLAESAEEVRASQRLRYQVFCEEMHAKPTPEQEQAGLEFDGYDAHADHLLVFDQQIGDGPRAVIGTYRLIRRPAGALGSGSSTPSTNTTSPRCSTPTARLHGVGPLVRRRPTTAPARSMQLLWRGIAEYVLQYDVRMMFGCGSMHGTDPDDAGPAAVLPLPQPSGAARNCARSRSPAATSRHEPAGAGRVQSPSARSLRCRR